MAARPRSLSNVRDVQRLRTVGEDVEHAESAVCMWPTCAEPVRYQRGGPRQQFCGGAHRVAYFRERTRLLAALDGATAAHAAAATVRARAAAEHDIGVVRWQLQRFADLQRPQP